MTMSDESVIVEAHSMLHEIQWAEDHEDTWPNNPLEVVAMLQKVTRYAAFLESRLYEDAPDPTPPPADTGAGDAETVDAPPLSAVRKWIDGAYSNYGEEHIDGAMQQIIDAVDGLYYHVRDLHKGERTS
jgi:hypothetical protein